MLNPETIVFLKMMGKVTDSMTLNYPITTGKTESSDIAYMFDLSKLDTDGFDSPIGIYKLSNFLNMFNLFKGDRDVKIDGNIIEVSDATTAAKYLTTSLEVMGPFEFKKEQFDKNDNFPTVLEMKLTADDLSKLRNASSVFEELDAVVITCNEHTEISLTQIGSFKASSNAFRIKKDEVGAKNFSVFAPIETLAKIPQADYNLVMKYNSDRDSYRIILSTEILTFVISAKNAETAN